MSAVVVPEVTISVKGWRVCRGEACTLPRREFYSEEPSRLCPDCFELEKAERSVQDAVLEQLSKDQAAAADERAAHEARCIRCINGPVGPIWERRRRCADYP